MLWSLYLICAYLTYYTFRYARTLWKDNCKLGAIATGVLACSFLPLSFAVVVVK